VAYPYRATIKRKFSGNVADVADTRLNKRSRGQGRTQDFPRLLGGRLCLLFANTVEGPIGDAPVDFLGGYTDLARWGWHAGALQETELDQLTAGAEQAPEAAAAVFRRAMALRAAVDRLFRATAHAERPDDRDLATVWDEYARAVAHGRLGPTGDGYDWSWEGRPDDLGRPLWPVARSAVELLTGGDLRRVKECPGADDCGWLFYDTSRNGARRWCSMEGCGSRVKMRRHYARQRAGDPPAGG
jgi:predicted RNA-binding Zn ribbon-like protein